MTLTIDSQSLTTVVPSPRALAPLERCPAELHVIYPRALRTRFVLRSPTTVLGRQPQARGLVLRHEFVSRQHFVVEWDPQRALHTGRDLGSANGSAIDGAAATSQVALRDGSLLRVGPVLLIYECPARVAEADAGQASLEALPGAAAATRQLRAEVGRCAHDGSPVLLCGETGTGKEFIAREIHRLSGRSGRLLAVNCAALSPQLVESELFGHVRGAFTGAQHEQAGLFREATGGTLLLDELGELPLSLQPKLLRVLQEKSVRPVGGARELPVDVRVIAATNRDLPSMVERNAFRRDLYARLSVSEISVPSLQRRSADILDWVDKLYARSCLARGWLDAPALRLDTDTAEALAKRVWLDNLRGVERLVHAWLERGRSGGVCTLADLPEWFWIPAQKHAVLEPLAVLGASAKPERRATPSPEELRNLLQLNRGSVRAVARHLGRDRRQIYRWIDAFALRAD